MNPSIINIVAADQVGDYRIRLTFDDGTAQVVDFRPFLQRSQHPDIRVYLEAGRFAGFRIEYGELVWGDYELCFPVIDLYRNQLDKSVALEAAA
ncbi:MAG: DUF2442 domain-containing protein [Sulfuritalea sp.]|nr:DUF2442 domain-containing protein [Sulfuritalea sp.]MDP1982242.1 DUF2442 domain-containing protein [Sulfuritalea sp.]